MTLQDIKNSAGLLADRAATWAEGAAKSLVQAGSNAISSIVGGVNKVFPNMLPTATAALAELSFRGTQGSFASSQYPIILKCEFMDIAEVTPELFGYPTNEFKILGQLTGMTVCKDTHVSFPCTVKEEEAIEQFLNNGVFLEWGDRL